LLYEKRWLSACIRRFMGSASWRPAPSSAAATATMRSNRPADTGPEVRLRAALHAKGLRFRKSVLIRLPHGRTHPDIVFSRRKVIVYVDGCFWHSCPHHGSVPVANADYWIPKLQRIAPVEGKRHRLSEPCPAAYSYETKEGAQKPSALWCPHPCSPWKGL
jgi:DNA mismatch endonuclease (patch repair protein)